MIEALGSSLLLGYLSPVALFTAAICLLVLRAGASRVFFDIVGTFQATKMIKDADSAATVFEALHLDALTGIQEAGQELGEIFNGLTDAMVPIAREFQEAAIQLDKFLQEGENLAQIRDEVEEIGMQFAFSGDQAMEAAAKMAQVSGVLGPGSLGAGTEVGMQFGLISGMETEAAMQRMINLQQQTQFMTKNLNDNMSAEQRATQIRRDSMVVLDELNTIENRSAATMEQITFVMNQFASQAHLANEEIRSMAALSAVMIETGEEQGKGGRALRMMFARLGSNIGGARDEMERFGVSVTDSEGNMRPLSVMLKEMEAGFFAQTGAQQQNTAQIIAGNRHYTRFLKLITNLDRVRELELESAMRLFPAMDEIERRRTSELFKLEQAEAGVRKYSAALGEALLPTMTSVTQKQASFLAVLSEMVASGGPLGSLIGGFLSLSKHFSTIVGPAAGLIIAFKSFSISMQTQMAVMRALNQQQGINNLNLNQEINLLQQSNMRLSKNAGLRAIHSEKIKENTANLRIFTNAQKAGVSGTTASEIALKTQTKQLNNMSMQLGGAGTMLMLFGNNQKIMKAGVLLNTAAIAAQIIQMGLKLQSQVSNTFATQAQTTATHAETGAVIKNTGAKVANTAANTANTVSKSAMAAAAGKTALKMSGFAVAAFVAVEAIDFFTKKNKKAKESVDELKESLISATDVMELMSSEAFNVVDAERIVAEQQNIIDNIQLQYDEGEKLSLLDQERVRNATRLRDLNQAAIDETEELNNLRSVLSMTDEELTLFGSTDINELKRQASIMHTYTGSVGDDLGSLIKEYDRIELAMGDYGEEFLRIFKETGDVEQAKQALQSYHDILVDAMEPENVVGMADAVEVANKTLTEFLNSREEMFHGFSTNNLTGDLVRQVQQQGVETLITNTEVVMTNVFNGMTIPEMADLLIEEIEIRGRANGFNVTANVA